MDVKPRGHHCDGCKIRQIKGLWFQCTKCTYFDFCEGCFNRNINHEHDTFYRFDNYGSEFMSFRSVFRPAISESSLSEDLQLSFLNNEFSDLKIVCNGEKFDCHRVILAARSPVFRAMLQNGFTEGTCKEINLDILSSQTVKDMLYYMYCDKIDNLKENTVELFKVADQYQIDNLKERCSYHLRSTLNVENCLEYLVLADIYRDQCLKKSGMEYVEKNIKSVMETPKWKEIEKDYPDVKMDIMESLLKSLVH